MTVDDLTDSLEECLPILRGSDTHTPLAKMLHSFSTFPPAQLVDSVCSIDLYTNKQPKMPISDINIQPKSFNGKRYTAIK